MKNIILALILSTITLSAIAQQSKIDSLLNVYQKQDVDSLKVQTLIQICGTYYYIDNKIGLQYVDTLLTLSRKSKKYMGVSFALRYQGNILTENGKFNEAIDKFEESLDILDSLGEHNNKYSDYMNMGNTYRYKRDLDKAEEYYNKAIEIATRLDKKDRLVIIYNNLGVLEISRGNYTLAIEYLTKSLENKDYNNNLKRSVSTYNNLGIIHYEIEQYEKSKGYFEEALRIAESEEYTAGIADAKTNISKCLVILEEQLEVAIEYAKNAINIYKKLDDNVFLLDAYSILGQAYEKQNDYNNAILYHSKAVELSEEIHMENNILSSRIFLAKALLGKNEIKKAEKELDYILKDTLNENLLKNHIVVAYATKSELSRKKGDYKNAYLYQKRFKNLNDEILSEKRVKNINEIETKFATAEKEKENLQLKQENTEKQLQIEKENRRKWIFGLGLVASLITLCIFGYYYRRNKKQKRLIENLQKELHHRVKNNLAIIDTFIDVTKEGLNNNRIERKLIELQHRIESINEVHEQLYVNTDVTNLDVQKYVEKLSHNVQQSFSNDNITIKKSIPNSLTLQVDKSFPIGLIVNEFLTNSYKYAFDEGKAGIISLSLREDSKGYLLSLSDNGRGLPDDFNLTQLDTFGLDVIQLLTKQLKGVFSLDSSSGVNINIQFPK